MRREARHFGTRFRDLRGFIRACLHWVRVGVGCPAVLFDGIGRRAHGAKRCPASSAPLRYGAVERHAQTARARFGPQR